MAFPEQDKSDKPPARVQLTPRDIRDAVRLLELIARSGGTDDEEEEPVQSPPGGQAVDPDLLLARARRLVRERELRTHFFSRSIFGEHAWDILLILYISEASGRSFTLRRLAERIDAPLSTTQRWIGYLRKERLVDQENHPVDKRMVDVRLLGKGRELLENYLGALSI